MATLNRREPAASVFNTRWGTRKPTGIGSDLHRLMKRYTSSIWENKYNQLINNGCCLVSIVAAVVLVGCGQSQPTKPQTTKAPDISIHEAAKEGNIEAVKQHLAAGADVNAKEEWGWTPLHFTTTKEIAELLIGNGADVNAKNDGGFTPLHYAASRRDKEIAELLIAKDADVNAKMEDGDTPLDWAIEINRTETADLLRKHNIAIIL